MDDYYFHNQTVIINYTRKYVTNAAELVDSEGFHVFLDNYMEYLRTHNQILYLWLTDRADAETVKAELVKLSKLLMIMEPEEIHHPALQQPEELLAVIEAAYNYWRKMQRYSIMYTQNAQGYQRQNFIEADSQFNAMVLNFYRTIQQFFPFAGGLQLCGQRGTFSSGYQIPYADTYYKTDN